MLLADEERDDVAGADDRVGAWVVVDDLAGGEVAVSDVGYDVGGAGALDHSDGIFEALASEIREG